MREVKKNTLSLYEKSDENLLIVAFNIVLHFMRMKKYRLHVTRSGHAAEKSSEFSLGLALKLKSCDKKDFLREREHQILLLMRKLLM